MRGERSETMNQCVIGIDIGTSGTKTIAVDQDGKILASALVSYPLYTPKPGWNEQAPEDWWQAAAETLKKVTSRLEHTEIVGIGLSGQMHGMVALDENGAVVRRALLWNDQRTAAQCEEITRAAGGLSGLLSMTNNRMLTGFTGGKILWMRENEPENFAKTVKILNPKDYIGYQLTGELATEVSDASGTGLFDVKNRKFHDGLLAKLGLSKDLFGRCIESTEIRGTVTEAAAAQTGVPAGVPVVGGGGDAVISTTAMGLTEPGRLGLVLGTSGVVATGLPSFMENPEGKLQVFCNNAPGMWHVPKHLRAGQAAPGAKQGHHALCPVGSGGRGGGARRAGAAVFAVSVRRAVPGQRPGRPRRVCRHHGAQYRRRFCPGRVGGRGVLAQAGGRIDGADAQL